MVFKKKFLAFILSLSLLLGLLPVAGAEPAAGPSLPAVGDVLHGFEVIEVGTFELLGAPAVLLEHVKTGAGVYFIQNGDTNRAFDITFRTPALDNTGAPHVFEHATISGSENYPSPNLFFPMTSQTYNTFINAMTGQSYTTYPLASLSEDQLYKLCDMYLDGVFNPLLYQEERLYNREAWRYELTDKEAPITITGTVYNEMKGARTISRLSNLNMMKSLFPNSIAGNDSGGDPDFIPELTYQQLLDFHDEYYHPSNSMTILYGDLDLPRFLALLDESYFSKYEKKEIEIASGAVPPQTQLVEASYPFPVEASAVTESAAYLTYSFVANGLSRLDEFGVNLLTSMLSHESSPLVQAMREALPGSMFQVYIDFSGPEPVIAFSASGVNQEDAETFKATVDQGIADILKNGLNQDVVDAVIAANKFAILMTAEESNVGPQLAISVGVSWAQFGTVYYYNEFLSAIDSLSQAEGTRYYHDLLDRYVVNNAHSALVCTYPQPGLAEEKAAALEAQLTEYKASLSSEELDMLIQKTADLAAFSAEEPPREMIQGLQAVTVDTLPEEMEIYPVMEREEDGIRILTSQVRAGAIGYTGILLDTACFPVEDLHYLALYASLLGTQATTEHTKEEIATLNTRYLNGISISPIMMETPGKVYVPRLSISWIGLMDEYDQSLNLAKEILYNTRFTNTNEIKTLISIMKNNLRDSLSMSSYAYQIARARSVFQEHSAYESFMSGLDMYYALSDMEALMEENPQAVLNKLAEVQQTLFNKSNAIAYFTGNEDALRTFDAAIPSFFGDLPVSEYPVSDLSAIPLPALQEALVIDSQVQYNLLYAPLEELGLTEDSGIFSPLASVIYDAYLTPKLRHGIGAYDSISSMSRGGLLFCSYRDPAIAETFAVYQELPAFLRSIELSQEDLNRYIISAYSSYAMPVGSLNGAATALSLYIAGRAQEEKLDRMREMKAFTVEELRGMADVFQKLLDNGARSTSGGAAAIEANKTLYDEILTVE